ncbi:SseB family protein [Micromonospora qiuiae]|uniref:SseB family protein n=1 Tax=Micromonospora qiuiae TaxID=502268 RepID=UPI001950B5B8|nr:SseB family protein [Micromonospora qiuiae]
MTDWEPATEAEVAMRDALRNNDQQLYFRILSRVELLLPLAAEAPGHAPAGWGTWTTGGRTHVLAFTSVEAMRACLGEHAGPSRRIGYPELAANWPNHEWWLAVNPGLPVEGYLPAWYVTQLSRGDVRLPGRTVGTRARLERVEALNRARAAATAGPTAQRAPDQRPADVGPSPAPPPVVPAAFHLPEVPPSTPSTVAEPHRPRPAGRAPGQPDAGRIAPEGPRPAGGDRLAPPGGDRPGATGPTRPAGVGVPVGGVGPDGRGVLPPRRPMPPAEGVGLPGRGWPAAPERSGAPANGGPAEPGVDQAGRRSFFEPAAARPASRSDRLADRATPPPRLGRSGQPFPRRGPAAGPPGGGEPRAFVFTDDARSGGAARPEPGGEVTQLLASQAGSTSEPTRPLGLAPEVSRTASPGANPTGAEATQALPRRRTTEPTEEPPSIAEPVSGPPAPRRDFKPIVIEGTIIEARDLTAAPAFEDHPHPAVGETRTGRPEADVPLDSNVGADAERTVPTPTIEPEPTVPILPSPVGVSAEPTVPIAPESPVGVSAEPAVPIAPEPPVGVPAEPTAPAQEVPAAVVADFQPANEVEKELLSAANAGNTDTFLSTLLLARVLMPVAADSAPGSRPGDPGFVWPAVELDGQTFVLGYTSPQRFADHTDPAADTIQVRFVQMISRWPDPSWSFAVNPGTPVGAKLPGEQIVGLSNWATELGLGDDPESEPEPSADPPAPSGGQEKKPAPVADPARPIVMQKAVAPSQLGYYLERGYDRVSGFVHRATELAHLTTPAQLYRALGLHHPESPFTPDADEIYVLRWPAYRPSLYRIPYGGQNEAAMRAMEGWVIERPPFRGNGFAPGESSDVLAEFKVDSVRLPHGAQLLRLGADGTERLVAVLDADTVSWRRVGEQ